MTVFGLFSLTAIDTPPMSPPPETPTSTMSGDAPIEEIYASFEEAPLACASIGQVHRATLRSDNPELPPVQVVVKVQRPRIRATIERDLDLLYFLARVVERVAGSASIGVRRCAPASADTGILRCRPRGVLPA